MKNSTAPALRLLCLALLFCLLPTGFAGDASAAAPHAAPPHAPPSAAFPLPADRVHTKVTGGLVNVAVDFGDDSPGVPLNALLHALASYPQAHRFRVSWITLIMLNGENQTAVYDRRKHSVIVYSTYTEGDNGGHTSFLKHLRYTHVQEKDFAKIAATHKGDTSDWDWFDDLSKYGCRKRELGSRYTGTRG